MEGAESEFFGHEFRLGGLCGIFGRVWGAALGLEWGSATDLRCQTFDFFPHFVSSGGSGSGIAGEAFIMGFFDLVRFHVRSRGGILISDQQGQVSRERFSFRSNPFWGRDIGWGWKV